MTLSQSILATLSYHDIFDYPLTFEEVHKYIIGVKSSSKIVEKYIDNLLDQKKILKKGDYYYLKNSARVVSLRNQREGYSKEKLRRAKLFATLLKSIPTLKLVAISGALAMNNSHKNDDIDLVLITSHGTLWTSRFLSSFILHLFRRKPESAEISNKACLNMFFDESSLKVKEQNIYTAQQKLLWYLTLKNPPY